MAYGSSLTSELHPQVRHESESSNINRSYPSFSCQHYDPIPSLTSYSFNMSYCGCAYWHIPNALMKITTSDEKQGQEHQLLHPTSKKELKLCIPMAGEEEYGGVSLAKLFPILRRLMFYRA
jgi:hypothetical protein